MIKLYSWLSGGLATTQMVLVNWKHAQIIGLIILKKSC